MGRGLVFLFQLTFAFWGLFLYGWGASDYGPGDPIIWALEFVSIVLLSFVFYLLSLFLQKKGRRTRIVMSAVFLFLFISFRIWEFSLGSWHWGQLFWMFIHPALPELLYLLFQIKQKPVNPA